MVRQVFAGHYADQCSFRLKNFTIDTLPRRYLKGDEARPPEGLGFEVLTVLSQGAPSTSGRRTEYGSSSKVG